MAAPSAVAWCSMAAILWHASRITRRLSDGQPDDGLALPALSIVVPALNEEAVIEPAMRSLLALDYPNLEVVAVDDRSTDRTGEILDRLAAENPRLHVRHVKDIPAGWLGKNHALHSGSEIVRGEWILFTDG